MTDLESELREFSTQEDTGDKWNPRAWPETLRYRREFTPHVHEPILRRHVLAKAEGRPLRGIYWSLVWGYSRGKLMGSDKHLHKAMADLRQMAHAVDFTRRHAPPDAADMIRELNEQRAHLGTASTSKIAYFARLTTEQGPALILDSQVIRALAARRDPELSGLTESELWVSAEQQAASKPSPHRALVEKLLGKPAFYAAYLREVNGLAARLGVEGEQIERFLFTYGRRHGKEQGEARSAATRAARREAKAAVRPPDDHAPPP